MNVAAEDGTPKSQGADPGSEQRNARGRFAAGNAGGPGSPIAAQAIKLRQAAMEVDYYARIWPRDVKGNRLLPRFHPANPGHTSSVRADKRSINKCSK